MTAGPFRAKPWPLEVIRFVARRARLLRVRLFGRFRFRFGRSVSLASGADIRPPHSISFGSFVSIGKNFVCETDLIVGSHVLISSNVSIVGKDHPFESESISVYEASRVDDSLVRIGNDVLIGFGTIIVGPVTVGDHCIVGAGSVVTRDLPSKTVCVGVPARVIRARYRNSHDVMSSVIQDKAEP